VVPHPGQQFDENALRDFCIKALGQFKSPRNIYVLEELPKGPSGKIQRLKLSGDYSS
jgi:long-chain acyl-CoA synthetase